MKLRSVISFLLASVAIIFATSCENKEQLGSPACSLDQETISVAKEAADVTINLVATRDWTATCDAKWLAIAPESGSASAKAQKVTVTILANDGFDRSADVVFTIGSLSATLTVNQAGKGSAEAAVVYFNDFDKEEAKTYGTGTSWPYLDQFEGWKNEKGSGAANVTYTFNAMSARANSMSNSNYSDYEGSGSNNLFFGASAYIRVSGIALSGRNFTLSFGSEKYLQTGSSLFSKDEFKVYVSNDGSKWVALDYAFAKGSESEGRWDLASATFTVPAGISTLSIHIAASVASAYRLDDLKLEVSDVEGATIDFASGIEIAGSGSGSGSGSGGDDTPGEVKNATVAEIIAEASTTTTYRLTGKVGAPIQTTYGNYDIIDETGTIYVYGTSNWADWKDKVAEGGTITVTGKYQYYASASKHELVDVTIESYTVPAGGGETPDPEVTKDATIAEVLAEASTTTNYRITGTVSDIEYGSGNYNVTDATGTIYIYKTINWSEYNDIKDGGKVTLVGKYQYYEAGQKHELVNVTIEKYEGERLPQAEGITLSFPDENSANNKVGAYESEWSAKIGSNTWTIKNFNNNNWNNNWAYIKCGHKSTALVASIATDGAISDAIKKVTLSVDSILDASKVNTCYLEISANADFSGAEKIDFTLASPMTEVAVVSPKENQYYRIVIDCQAHGSKNGIVTISKVVYSK